VVVEQQRRYAGQKIAVAASKVGNDQRSGRVPAQTLQHLRSPRRLTLSPRLGRDLGEAGRAQRPKEKGSRGQTIRIAVAQDLHPGRSSVGQCVHPLDEARAYLVCQTHAASDAKRLAGVGPHFRSTSALQQGELEVFVSAIDGAPWHPGK